jgi:hypothetical protein
MFCGSFKDVDEKCNSPTCFSSIYRRKKILETYSYHQNLQSPKKIAEKGKAEMSRR